MYFRNCQAFINFQIFVFLYKNASFNWCFKSNKIENKNYFFSVENIGCLQRFFDILRWCCARGLLWIKNSSIYKRIGTANVLDAIQLPKTVRNRPILPRGLGNYYVYKKFILQIILRSLALRENCPCSKFCLVRIFPHSDWIRIRIKIRTRKTPNIYTFHEMWNLWSIINLKHNTIDVWNLAQNWSVSNFRHS